MSVSANKRIALVGDYSPQVTAHLAIPKAIDIACTCIGQSVEGIWVATSSLHKDASSVLQDFSGVWCVPASPYKSLTGALDAIGLARKRHIPFLGTCGGYQHAVLEFARNVLGRTDADNAEVNPDAELPLIAPLSCALVEQSGDIMFNVESVIARIHGATHVTEKYHCSYGVAPQYVSFFDRSALDFVGFDTEGDPRAIEIKSHPFFIGTAYQPERSALTGASHPLIEAFVRAVVHYDVKSEH